MVFETEKRWDEYLSARKTEGGVSITVNKPRSYSYSIGLNMSEVARLHAYLGEVIGDGWQDIASAPKDGTDILTWTHGLCADENPFLVVKWQRGGWRSIDHRAVYFPTHWRQLHAGPDTAKEHKA